METPTRPQQWTATKFYWYALLLAFLFLSALAFIAYRSLEMGDDLSARLANFGSFNKKLFYANVGSFLILLVTAGYLHKKHCKRLFYIPACLLFVTFVYVGYMVLNVKFLALQEVYELGSSSFSANRLLGIALSVVGVLMAGVLFVGISISKRGK